MTADTPNPTREARGEDVELVARAIYCDGSYPPDTLGANDDKWAKTSEVQRQFCRQQARAAIAALPTREAECALALRLLLEKATQGVWQEGRAGQCNLVSFDGEDVVGIGIMNNAANRALVVAMHAAARAALSASPPPSGWQPIETLEIGEWALCWGPLWRHPYPAIRHRALSSMVYLDLGESSTEMIASHWKPLDTPSRATEPKHDSHL